MTDIFTREKRSNIMSKVRGKDTRPELFVRSTLHRMGLRFRLHRPDLPGTPDIVLPRHRKVIFVHGCFWHGHKGCGRSRRPTDNADFWNRKIDRNIERDLKVKRMLKKAGWHVIVVWECQTSKREKLAGILKRQFEDSYIS